MMNYTNSRVVMDRYLDSGLKPVPMFYRTKRPIPNPETGSWWIMEAQGDLDKVFRSYQVFNVALLCHDFIQVDPDSDESLARAVEKGLTKNDTWIVKTPRGHRFFYRAPNPCPSTFTDPRHAIPDLLAPGSLGIVPLSIHPSGDPYRWVIGHTPFEIPSESLAPLPEPILEAWFNLKSRPVTKYRPNYSCPGWVGQVFEAICEHLSNTGHRFHQTRGGGFITTCPLHDDRNPSLSIHPTRGWKCWAGCGQGRLTILASLLGINATEEMKK